MQSIVPLFRQNTGRVNLGLVNWDSFQAGFRMLMRGDKFVGVTWDPWWHERKSEKRRNGQRRTIPERRLHDKAGYRFYSEGESVEPLRLVHARRKQLRHSDPRITLGVYAHVIGDQQRRAFENRSARIEQYAVN
jgi:hypothetical protein